MKIRALVFLLMVPLVHAGQQNFIVTPQTLSDWQVIGADAPAVSSQPVLALPAGAQLVRSFDSSAVVVQLTTQPVIGATAQNWPVLELGSTALIFSREGSAGRLLLVIGDESPKTLPFSFALDTNGRSVNPLSLVISCDGTGVWVAMGGQTIHFPAAPASLPLEIVASAGDSAAWDVASMEVMVGVPDPVSIPVRAGPRPTNPSTEIDGLAGRNATAQASSVSFVLTTSLPVAMQPPVGAKALAAVAPVSAQAGGSMDVFTPGSVRKGRAGKIRAGLPAQAGN